MSIENQTSGSSAVLNPAPVSADGVNGNKMAAAASVGGFAAGVFTDSPFSNLSKPIFADDSNPLHLVIKDFIESYFAQPMTEPEALNTLALNWDDLKGGDDTVSMDDLTKAAADETLPKDLRDAAQFFIDNEDEFYKLDTGSAGGDGDSAITDADLSARLKTTPLNDADRAAIDTLEANWKAFSGGGDEVSVADIASIAKDPSQPAALRDAAQHFLDNPQLISRFDITTEEGTFDGRISFAGLEPVVNTGLGVDVDNLAALSPTLAQEIETIQRAGYTIEFGPAGGGSFHSSADKRIVLDANLAADPAEVVRVLAHEAGHARYKEEPFVPIGDLTREEFVEQNTQRNLNNEGEATLVNLEIRQEILDNGGVDIGVSGAQAADYIAIFDSGKHETDRAGAREDIANLFATGERPSTDPSINYEQYYGQFWGEYYDNNAPTS